MPHTFKHLTHDESLVLAASVIGLVKRHKSELYESLSTLDPEYTDQERKDMINEILINIAEDFDLSADLVIPGEGYRRSQKRIFQDLDFDTEFGSSKLRKTAKKLEKSERGSSTPPPTPNDGETPQVASQPAAAPKPPPTGGSVKSRSQPPSKSQPPSQSPQPSQQQSQPPSQLQPPLPSSWGVPKIRSRLDESRKSQSQSQPSSLPSASTTRKTSSGTPGRLGLKYRPKVSPKVISKNPTGKTKGLKRGSSQLASQPSIQPTTPNARMSPPEDRCISPILLLSPDIVDSESE